jgi:tetratricopeptide (TPR) repeat protein
MNIESHFGRGSYESADYMRNYIIPYYLEKGDAVYVQKFANYALNIYKNSSDYLNQVADILRLYGRSEILFKKEYRGYELYTTALTVLTSAPKPDFVIYINVVDDIAQYYKTQSKTDLIIELYADAIKEIEAKDPSAGAPLAAAYRNLGKAYCENEEYAKAPKFYEKSIAIIKTLPRGDTLRKQIAPIMYELADIYEKANLYADSKKMKQEAYRYQAKSFLSFI